MQGPSHKGIKVDLEDLETLINRVLANRYDFDDYQHQQQHGMDYNYCHGSIFLI
jgi:hypothetical protein